MPKTCDRPQQAEPDARGCDAKPARWFWPLARRTHPIPELPAAGAFGAVRRHDVHTGVDLYAEPGDQVFAVERGTVVAVEDFTGVRAGSPWWHDTFAVLIEGESGVVLYGEVDPAVAVGDPVERGALVGRVLTVLKKNKGLPMTMLHFELYDRGARASAWWRHEEPKPEGLLDPTASLKAAAEVHAR